MTFALSSGEAVFLNCMMASGVMISDSSGATDTCEGWVRGGEERDRRMTSWYEGWSELLTFLVVRHCDSSDCSSYVWYGDSKVPKG